MTKKITKKRNNTFRLLTSIAIVMLMSVSMILPGLAAPGEGYKYSESLVPGEDAKSAITKLYKVPYDTENPAAVFTFNFEAVGFDGGDNTSGMPGIPSQSISYDVDDQIAHVFVEKEEGVEATTILVKESDDLLGGTPKVEWNLGAGVYTYILSESQSGIVLPLAEKEGYDYSKAKYEVEFWVFEYDIKDNDGNVTGTGLYVRYVNAKLIAGSYDEYYEGKPGDGKVDPTPGEFWTNKYNDIKDGFSQLIFTNKYWMSDGDSENPDPDKSVLDITKTINGYEANKDLYFEFEVMVTQPSIIPLQKEDPNNPGTMISNIQVYKAYIVGADNKIVLDTKGNNGVISGTDDDGDYFLLTSGIVKEINLTDGQKLIFVDLHIGSKVAVEEKANSDYTPKYERTFAVPGTYKGVANTVWGFPRSGDAGPHFLPKGNNNEVNYTNTRVGTTPTGLAVDDLPYIILIGLAAASLAGIIVVKLRKGAKDSI